MNVSWHLPGFKEEPSYQQLVTITAGASVAVSVLLIVVKMAVWGFSGSVGLLASVVDSTMDVAASLINFVAIRYAMQPPDDEHRFGHGKAESIAAFAQAMFIAGSACFLFIHAVDRMMNPRVIEHSYWAIGVMVFSIVITGFLVLLQRYTISRTKSLAIKADSAHYVADLLMNAAIIVGLLLSQLVWIGSDALAGLLVGGLILFGAYQVGYEAIQQLLDRALPESEEQTIARIVQSEEGVLGFHELKTRQVGPKRMIQMHLEIDKTLSLEVAHGISEKVEAAILEVFPDSELIIHQDPC